MLAVFTAFLCPLRMLQMAIRSMATGGRYLVVGFASGVIPSPPLNLLLLKEASMIGIFWGAWWERKPEEGCVLYPSVVPGYSLHG